MSQTDTELVKMEETDDENKSQKTNFKRLQCHLIYGKIFF